MAIGINNWILDSGASDHMTFDRNSFVEYQSFVQPKVIRLGDEHTITAYGYGTVKLMAKINSGIRPLDLEQTLYVPGIRRKLISIGAAMRKGYQVLFKDSSITISKKGGDVIMEGSRVGTLCKAEVVEIVAMEANSTESNKQGQEEHIDVEGDWSDDETIIVDYDTSTTKELVSDSETIISDDMVSDSSVDTDKEVGENIKLWHNRFGHISMSTIMKMNRLGAVSGLRKLVLNVNPKRSDAKIIACESCCLAKHARTPIPLSSRVRADKVGENLHIDICGPIGKVSLSGAKYFILMKDEFSHYRHIYFLKTKDEALDCVKKCVAAIKSDTK